MCLRTGRSQHLYVANPTTPIRGTIVPGTMTSRTGFALEISTSPTSTGGVGVGKYGVVSSSVGFAEGAEPEPMPDASQNCPGIGNERKQECSFTEGSFKGKFTPCLASQDVLVATESRENSVELTVAALAGKHDEVNKLLTKGKKAMLGRTGKPVHPDSRDDEGFTALYLAVQEGHIPVIKSLTDAGADPCIPGCRDGITPLCLAAGQGDIKALMLLLGNGASPNASSEEGVSPLMIAAQNGHAPVVACLISAGAQVDYLTPEGDSALICAARKGHLEEVRLLLEGGATKDLKGQRGRTALDWVRMKVRDDAARNALAEMLRS